MKNKIIYMFLLLSLLSCTKPQPTSIMYIQDSTYRASELKKLVLTKGDEQAYNELSVFYSSQEYPEEYLVYSLLMANKYHYPPAYFDVYFNLILSKTRVSDNLDDATKSLALDYIKKGASLKDPDALRYLGYLYLEGNLVKKDTIVANKLLKECKRIVGY